MCVCVCVREREREERREVHRGPQSARIYLPQSKVAVDLFYITLAALSRSSSVRQLQKSIVKSALSLSGSVSLSLSEEEEEEEEEEDRRTLSCSSTHAGPRTTHALGSPPQ